MKVEGGVIYLAIIACEAGFWVFLFAGLVARYVLRWRLVAVLLLLCVPLVDLALLIFTALHLHRGASATFAHGLAAAYIGFTIALGGPIIRWADARFARHSRGDESALPPPVYGWRAVLEELKLWLRCIIAVVITYGLLILLTEFVNDPERTKALDAWFQIPISIVGFWFIFGPLWQVVFFKRGPSASSPAPPRD